MISFCLDLSYLYSKLVQTYSMGLDKDSHAQEDTDDSAGSDDESGALLPQSMKQVSHPHFTPGAKKFMAMYVTPHRYDWTLISRELHLQGQLGTLNDLLKHTKNEPRLKGPFAFGFYKECLLSCERMLDRLHSMRCVTTRAEWSVLFDKIQRIAATHQCRDHSMRESFVVPVNSHRREMAGNVILYVSHLPTIPITRTDL